jgi:hypothetical protein
MRVIVHLLAAWALAEAGADARTTTVRVTGTTDCPSVAGLSQALAGVALDVRPDPPASFDVSVEVRGDADVVVEIAAAPSHTRPRALIERRRVTEPMSCAERADAAAVLAASAIAGATVEAPLPAAPDPAIVTASPVVEARAAVREPHPVARSTEASWSAGVSAMGAMALVDGVRAVPGFVVDVGNWLTPALALRGELFWLLERELPAFHPVAWQRAGGGVGVRLRDPDVRWWFADASVLLAYTTVRGDGFDFDRSDAALVPGFDLAVGAGWWLMRDVHFELQLGAFVWAARERLSAAMLDGVPLPGGALPAVDFTFRMRWALGFGRRRA